MRSGRNSRMAAMAAGAAKEASRYSMPLAPRRWRAAAMASGSRSRPRTVAPTSRRIAAWPPPPSVASTARVLPLAHARTAAARTGMWYGIDGEPEAAVATLHNKKPPPFGGAGAGVGSRELSGGADGARTRDLRGDRPGL